MLFLVVLSAALARGQDWSDDEVDTDEYKVYCKTLWQLAEREGEKPFFIVIDTTVPIGSGALSDFGWKTVDYIKQESGIELDEDTVIDFQKNNDQPYKFRARFRYYWGLMVYLVSRQAMDNMLTGIGLGGGWDEFYRKYRDSTGLSELSRVGFNKDQTLALLYYGNQRAYLQGKGYYIILKKDVKWNIVAMVKAWEQ